MTNLRVPSAEKGGARGLLLSGNYDPSVRGVHPADVTSLETQISDYNEKVGFNEVVARRVRLVKLAMYAVSLCHEQPIEEDESTALSRELGRAAMLLGNYDNYGFSSLQSRLKDSLVEKADPNIPSLGAVDDMVTQQAVTSYEAAAIKVILSAAVVSSLGGHLPSLDRKA